MRKQLYALAGAALLTMTIPVAAGPQVPTDVSGQVSIEVPGAGVRLGHGRYRSDRRRDHSRWESRGDRRGCQTVTVRERMPDGSVVVRKRTRC